MQFPSILTTALSLFLAIEGVVSTSSVPSSTTSVSLTGSSSSRSTTSGTLTTLTSVYPTLSTTSSTISSTTSTQTTSTQSTYTCYSPISIPSTTATCSSMTGSIPSMTATASCVSVPVPTGPSRRSYYPALQKRNTPCEKLWNLDMMCCYLLASTAADNERYNKFAQCWSTMKSAACDCARREIPGAWMQDFVESQSWCSEANNWEFS